MTILTWKRRLRDLLLAGGRLAALACSNSGSGGTGGTGGTAGSSGTGGVAGSGGSGIRPHTNCECDSGGPTYCCNASPDPCCDYTACGTPMSPACACKLDGGVYTSTYGGGTCAPDAGSDGAAGPFDAGNGGAG